VNFLDALFLSLSLQIKSLFQNFYANISETDSCRFLQTLRTSISHISMAALQGYLLRYKDTPEEAITNIDSLRQDIENREREAQKHGKLVSSSLNNSRKKEVKPRPVRPLTVDEVDKMYFNPQPGWDKDL
jgi:hypothetical protein